MNTFHFYRDRSFVNHDFCAHYYWNIRSDEYTYLTVQHFYADT